MSLSKGLAMLRWCARHVLLQLHLEVPVDARATMFSANILQGMWQLVRPFRTRIPVMLMLILSTQLLQMIPPFLFGRVVDAVGQSAPRPELVRLIVFMTVTAAMISAINVARNFAIFGFLLRLEQWLPIKAQEKLVSLSLAFHERAHSGATSRKVQNGCDRFEDLIANCLFEFIPTLFQTFATFLVLLSQDWVVGCLFVPSIPAFLATTHWVNHRVRHLRVKRFEGYERATENLVQSLTNIHAVQSFTNEELELNRHRAIRNDVFQTEMKEWRMMSAFNFVRDAFIILGQASVLCTITLFRDHSQLSGGSLVMMYTLASTAYYSLFRLSRLYDRGAEWAEAVRRLTNLFAEMPSVRDPDEPIALEHVHGAIRFDHVTFDYGNEREVLRDVSVEIPAGATVALVGPSGCGKSTFVNLLLRHYDPTEGSISLDGHDIRSLSRRALRSTMAVVDQHVGIFSRTLFENIAYGKPGATEAEVLAAARFAQVDTFVRDLPQGYHTHVGERGMKLSGGQRQRVGIARAILADPKILILDEATSSLDSFTEAEIQRDLALLSCGRTTIIVAHRLSTIRHADRIIVLDNGSVSEMGTHEELLQRQGSYASFFDIQMNGYRQQPIPDVPSLPLSEV